MEEFSVKDLSKADLVAIVKQQKKMIDSIQLMVKAHAENNHVSAEDFEDWLDNEAEMVINLWRKSHRLACGMKATFPTFFLH